MNGRNEGERDWSRVRRRVERRNGEKVLLFG